MSLKEVIDEIEASARFLDAIENAPEDQLDWNVAVRLRRSNGYWECGPTLVSGSIRMLLAEERRRFISRARRELFGALIRAEQRERERDQIQRERMAEVVARHRLGLPGSRRVTDEVRRG